LVRARGARETGVELTEDRQIIEVDLDGRRVDAAEDGLAVPLEIFIHTALYRRRPDIRSVVHLHPPMAMLCTVLDTPLLPIYGAYDPPSAMLAIAGIPTYDRSILISTSPLGEDLADALGSANACLMRGHGITTAGPSVIDAALNAISLNTLANMNYRAAQAGAPRVISIEDQASLQALEPSVPGAPSPTPRAIALWRYYREKTGS
jgi:3,4-dihydroxyphthalate decarboxylase